MSEISRMNYSYEVAHKQGYDKALMDVKDWFERHSISLKQNRMYNEKGINLLLNAFLYNSEVFKEYGGFTEFVLSPDRREITLSKDNSIE